MYKRMYEILEEVDLASKKEDKKAVLLNHNTPLLQQVLQGTFHPDIKFVIDKPIHYRGDTDLDDFGYQSLQEAMNKVYIWTVGSRQVNPNLSERRKLEILIQTLESLDKRESKVFMNMMLKDLKIKGLDYKLVKETFPDLLP